MQNHIPSDAASAALRPAVAAGIAGALVWYALVVLTGEREAFDDNVYFLIVPVVSAITLAFTGLMDRKTALIHAAAFSAGHVIAGYSTMGFGSLWPLAAIFLMLPTMPGYLVAGGYTLWWAHHKEPTSHSLPPRLPSPPIPPRSE